MIDILLALSILAVIGAPILIIGAWLIANVADIFAADRKAAMVDVLKDITTIEAMHNAEMEGYSRAYANEYARGRGEDYANANAYNSYRNYSMARGRDAMGRYTSRDSMAGGNSQYDKEDMINSLRMKAKNARSEEERVNYLDMADRLSM